MKIVQKIHNVFSKQEIGYINDLIDMLRLTKIENDLGIAHEDFTLPHFFKEKILETVNILFPGNLNLISTTYVECDKKYGNPNLPPNFDGGKTDLMAILQFASNIKWDMGLDKELYSLENNTALIFHPNEVISWRPIKKFNDDDYVRLIYFRFQNIDEPSDYSDLKLSSDHEIFKEIVELRNRLATDPQHQ